jgi:amino-acid N-acetyltransferase
MAVRKSRQPPDPPKLIAKPLALGERGALARALVKAKLPADDVDAPGRLFWRFEDIDQVPLGYGGLEIHGKDALLRSVMTLPPAQKRGVGRGIVAALEVEAAALACRSIWLLTADAAPFFAPLGYAERPREAAPETIRATAQWTSLCPGSATLMTKQLPQPSRRPKPAKSPASAAKPRLRPVK